MKSIKIVLPENLWKILKSWLLDFPSDENIKYSQNDYLLWLIANLPKNPKKFNPNHQLIEYLENPKNTKGLSADKIEQLKLIGKGILSPSAIEKEYIEKLLKES